MPVYVMPSLLPMIPVAGSAYTYSYATMGELIAWIIGWDLVLEYTVAATTVSISWSRYLVVFLEGVGINIPHALAACPWDGGIVNIPAALIVVLMSIFSDSWNRRKFYL